MGLLAVVPGSTTRRDLLVKAVSVQGGESDIAGEKTAFARIVMTGVDYASADGQAPRRREAAVLTLADVEELVAGLRQILTAIARKTPTPVAPAMGMWSWTSEPPLGDDLMVALTIASGTAIPTGLGVVPTVRVDFTGTSVIASTSGNPSAQTYGAIFAGTRQVEALISSLKKVVRSALESQRVDVYLGGDQALSAFAV